MDSTEILQARPLLMQRFEVISVLGEGAAGAVYCVKDKADNNREVALKVLINQSAFDQHTKRRFKEEWLISSKLVHKNLVRAYDLIQLDDGIAYTMEYVQGHDLSKLARFQERNFCQIDSIFLQLLSALAYLHDNGVYHRDIKLENILLTREGTVKLSDLGLMKIDRAEKLTKTGILLGTAQYMSPEYIKGSQYDSRSEVYAVGVLLYEMLGGDRLLANKTGNEIIEYLLKTNFSFPRLDKETIPKKYHYLLKRMLHPEPSQRFQSMQQLAAAFGKDVGYYDNGTHLREIEVEFAPQTSEPSKERASSFRVFRAPVLASISVCILIATIGLAVLQTGYFSGPLQLEHGSYQGTFFFNKSERKESVSLQIGTAAGVIVSKKFCNQGFLDLKKRTLSCGADSYRVVQKAEGDHVVLQLYKQLAQQGQLELAPLR